MFSSFSPAMGVRPQAFVSATPRQGVETPKLTGPEASAKITSLLGQLRFAKNNPEATAAIEAQIDEIANVFGASKQAMLAFLKK